MGKRENADATVIRHGKVRQRSIKIIMPSRAQRSQGNADGDVRARAPMSARYQNGESPFHGWCDAM